MKGKESDEALTAILIEWEDRGIANVEDRMRQAGYYLINGKIEAYDVTQRLGEQLDQSEIEGCIEVLDGLVTRYKNPDIALLLSNNQSLPLAVSSKRILRLVEITGCLGSTIMDLLE